MKALLFVGKKLLAMAGIAIGVTFFSFLLIYLSPSDAATMILESMGRPPSETVLEEKREEMGLNDPFFVQYGNWAKKVAQGDLGNSLVTKKPVIEELKVYLPKTLLLTAITMVLTVLISVPLGIVSALNKDTLPDRVISGISYFMVAWPSFFLALVVLYLFGVKLRWLPVSRSDGFVGIIMPVAVMTAGMGGWYIRQVKTVILEQMGKDYVLGMRARGIPPRVILYRHVLKNAWNPIFVLLGMSFGSMLGGTAVVECVFSWEGVGYWAVEAISKRDFPVIQGYVLWMAFIYIAVNFIVELVCLVIDPRLRKG